MFMEQGCVATRILRNACAHATHSLAAGYLIEVLTIAALVAPSDDLRRGHSVQPASATSSAVARAA